MLEGLSAEIDALCAADPSAVADPESLVELHCQLARLEALAARSAASFDASAAWQADGARTAATWMAVRCGLAKATASRRVRLGRALREMPVVEQSWLAGEQAREEIMKLHTSIDAYQKQMDQAQKGRG